MESKPKPRSLDDLIDPKRVSIEVKTLELAPEREARLRREEEDAAHDPPRLGIDPAAHPGRMNISSTSVDNNISISSRVVRSEIDPTTTGTTAP